MLIFAEDSRPPFFLFRVNDSTTLCSMEVYREDADEWEFSAYLQTGRTEFGAAVVPISIDQLSKL